MQEQKRRLERLAEGKAEVERKLDSADSDLRRREETSREEQQNVLALRQSLRQLSEREREVRARERERGSRFGENRKDKKKKKNCSRLCGSQTGPRGENM